MIQLTGVNKFMRKTEKQKERIEQGAANFVRAKARAILRDLVLNTPQWSGDTAASWEVRHKSGYADTRNYNDSDSNYDWRDLLNNPGFKGDQDAWREALERNAASLASIKYNSKIEIVNPNPTADWLATLTDAEAKKYLRSGNYIQGDVMAVKLVAAKHKLGSNIVGLELKKVFTP